MPVKSVRLQTELKPLDEETRWQETLQALESVHQGKVVDGDTVHEWIKSWGTKKELAPPRVSNNA
jgi:predicted transcriptional regulator